MLNLVRWLRAAVRWILDVPRGYIRVADGRERAAELLAHLAGTNERELVEQWFAFISDHLRALELARDERGGLGAGARLALTQVELEGLHAAAAVARAAIPPPRRPLMATTWEA